MPIDFCFFPAKLLVDETALAAIDYHFFFDGIYLAGRFQDISAGTALLG